MATEGSSAAVTDIEKKIIRQVEYYFGDLNLPKDKFLQDETKKDDGWVPLKVLLTFNRMKALTTDFEAIVAALKKSENGIVEISEDGTKIRRSKDKPLPENRLEFWKQLKERTAYVKGFPVDITLDQLMEFFEKFGKVENVVMRRMKNEEKAFKGSVFVLFDTNEACKSFLALDSVKYGDTELIKLLESVYYSKKNEERRQEKAKKQQEKMIANLHQKNANKKDKEQQNGGKSDDASKFTPGLIIHVKDLDKVEGSDRDDIKAMFQKHGEVDWIDFNRGDKEAWIRVKGAENEAVAVLDKLKADSDGKLLYKDVECPAEVLDGEPEKAYWVKTCKDRREALDRKSKHKKKNFNQHKKSRNFEARRGHNKHDRNHDKDEDKKEKIGSEDANKEKNGTEGDNKEKNGTGDAKHGSPVKRPAEDGANETPAAKVAKVE